MGSLAKGVLAESLRKFCGKFAEIRKNTFHCVRKGCGNSAEILRKAAEFFLQWPLPEWPHKWIAENHWLLSYFAKSITNMDRWNSSGFASLPTSEQIDFGPPIRERRKNGPKLDFHLTGKIGKINGILGYFLGQKSNRENKWDFGLFFRSEKLQNESSPNFSNSCPGFCPEFCSRIFPEFFEDFSCFVSKKNHQKSPAFFNAKFPGKYEKNYSQNVSGEQAK